MELRWQQDCYRSPRQKWGQKYSWTLFRCLEIAVGFITLKLQCGLTSFQLQHCLGRMTVIPNSSGKHDTVSSLLRKFSLLDSLAVFILFSGAVLQMSLGVCWWFGLAQNTCTHKHTQHSRSWCNLPALLIKQIYLASMLKEEPECLIQPASFPAFQRYTHTHTQRHKLRHTHSLFTFIQVLKCQINITKYLLYHIL